MLSKKKESLKYDVSGVEWREKQERLRQENSEESEVLIRKKRKKRCVIRERKELN